MNAPRMVLLLVGLMAATGSAAAAESRRAPPPPGEKEQGVDAGLLEFLGSLDLEDEDWKDYLVQGMDAQVKSPSRPKPTAPRSEPKDQGTKEKDKP